MKAGVLAEPVLVGRERELEELESFLKSAAGGKGKTVFVSGEAGSGKSRLAREFLNFAKQNGVGVMAGWCLSDAAVPYFPFIEAFNAYFASFDEEEQASLQQPRAKIGGPAQTGIEGREITNWLAGPKPLEKTGKPEPLSPQVWKDQAFDRVAKTLLTISIQGPLVIFLEDIHWADSASLALLHYISRVVNNSERILVLATFRSEEVTANAEGHPHQLEEEMRLMSREDLFSEIKLSNLNQADISVIAQNMMGGSVQQELVEKLARESNGNALFLVESLRMLVERKGLVQENNEWRLAVDDFGIPSKVKDIILRRLAVLKYAQRRVLDAASVIGEKFDLELLASVLGQDSLDVLETLNFIAQSTSIVTVEEALYRFDHERSREVLYEALSLPLKRGYHARVAERMESANKGGKMPNADLAYHYAQADNEEEALKYSLEAGKEALARCSNKEAIKSFQYVIQKVGDRSDRFAEKTAALEGLGDALYANNNFREAKETFEQLAEVEEGKVKLRALRKAIVAAFYEGDVPKIKELIQVAEKNASSDRVEAARILSHKARAGGLQVQFAYCSELLNAAISVYEEEYCLPDAAWDLFVVGNLAPQFGELEKGVAAALRSLALYDELGDIHSQLEAYLYAGNCFAYCTLDEEAIRFYSKVVEIDNRFRMNDYVRLIPAYVDLGIRLFWKDPKEAKVMGLKALECCDKTDSRHLGAVYEFLIDWSVVNGDTASGEEYFKKLMSLPQHILSSPCTMLLLEQSKALYFAGKNQFDEAIKCYDNQLANLKQYMPSPGMEAFSMVFYSWILRKQGRVAEAKVKLEQTRALYESTEQKFAHVNIHPGLMTFTHPEVNQTFEIRLDLVNVSKSQGSIIKVENLLVPALKIIESSPNCILNGEHVAFKDNAIKPFEVKTIKLTVMAAKPETFTLAPTVTYVDDLGQAKTSSTRLFTITVQPPQPKFDAHPGRVTTGSAELDGLLLGGVPQNYAVALTSPSCDERQLLIERFLEAGAPSGETTLYVTGEAGNVQNLAKQIPANFFALVCNLQANLMVQNLPNVYMLKGIDNLTEIDIALTKYFRTLDPVQAGTRRACIDLVSDVLLQHHAVITRKWLNGLILSLKAHGFTVLTVINPQMHQPEESQAVLSLFDGEIVIIERDLAKILRVRKLYNQKYLETEVTLTK